MLEATHSETYKGLHLRVYPDSDPADPREDYDHVAKMLCAHGRYTLGDEQFKTGSELIARIFGEFFPTGFDPDGGYTQDLLEKCPIIWLPLYLYDHGGITMKTTPFSCPWDSGQVGIIYVSLERAKAEWSRNEDETDEQWRERVYEHLRGEVTEYDQYITGQVYGFRVYESDPDESDDEPEELDASWGFFGESAAIEAAKEFIDATTQP
jgi:hypothetical protein